MNDMKKYKTYLFLTHLLSLSFLIFTGCDNNQLKPPRDHSSGAEQSEHHTPFPIDRELARELAREFGKEFAQEFVRQMRESNASFTLPEAGK